MYAQEEQFVRGVECTCWTKGHPQGRLLVIFLVIQPVKPDHEHFHGRGNRHCLSPAPAASKAARHHRAHPAEVGLLAQDIAGHGQGFNERCLIGHIDQAATNLGARVLLSGGEGGPEVHSRARRRS